MGRSKKEDVSLYEFSKNIWDNYRWELFIITSVFTIFICWLLKKKDSEYSGIYLDTSVLQKNKATTKKGTYKNEERCREIIQEIYNLPFKKVRPDFLKNPKTGRNLELDMYNDVLKIALEYNGIQHRTYAPYFHKSPLDYDAQVERDALKIKRCGEEGVTLITVPDTVRYNEMEAFIRSELQKAGRL
jgi:hypothetical protein